MPASLHNLSWLCFKACTSLPILLLSAPSILLFILFHCPTKAWVRFTSPLPSTSLILSLAWDSFIKPLILCCSAPRLPSCFFFCQHTNPRRSIPVIRRTNKICNDFHCLITGSWSHLVSAPHLCITYLNCSLLGTQLSFLTGLWSTRHRLAASTEQEEWKHTLTEHLS